MLKIWSPGNVFRLAFNEGIKISKLNKFYDGNKHLKDVDFLNAILDDLQIKFEILKKILRLPKEEVT
jgi:hypothetical protein